MSRAKGDRAEEITCNFLTQRGFLIIERNFYSRFGEIDIIAHKDELLHFIEVKSAQGYESAIQNVTPKKLQRILKTVDVYLKKRNINPTYVVDVVIVTPESIEFLENITF